MHIGLCWPFVSERDLLFALEPRRLFLALAGQAFLALFRRAGEALFLDKKCPKIKAWRLLLLPVAIHPARI